MASERPQSSARSGAPGPDDDFIVIYRQHAGTILRYVRRRLGDTAADNATADVFWRALIAQRAGTGNVGAPLPWLYGIATHVIADHHRAEKRRLRTLERLAREPTTPAAVVGGHAIDPSLARALRQLSAGDREALLLVAWGELTYDEVATALDLPIGTVRSRIHRARRQLDAHLSTTPGGATTTNTTGAAHG